MPDGVVGEKGSAVATADGSFHPAVKLAVVLGVLGVLCLVLVFVLDEKSGWDLLYDLGLSLALATAVAVLAAFWLQGLERSRAAREQSQMALQRASEERIQHRLNMLSEGLQEATKAAQEGIALAEQGQFEAWLSDKFEEVHTRLTEIDRRVRETQQRLERETGS